MQELKDKVLLYRVQAKSDTDAYAQLYDRYVDSLYRFIFFRVSSKELAEDLTADVFLKTWEYLGTKKGGEVKNFRALIYRISRNAIIDHYRKMAHRQEQSLQAAQLEPDTDVIETMIDDIEVKRLMQLVRKLKSEYQDVVILKYVEGMTAKQIGQVLDKSATSVRVTLHRALKILKNMS